VVTLGGKNIGRRYGRFRAFVADHGDFGFEHFGINSSRVDRGRLLTFDSSHRVAALRQLRGVPGRDLLRLGGLARASTRAAAGPYLAEDACASLERRFGAATVADSFAPRLRELLVRSLTVRVSAAEPDEVPMRNVMPYVGMITDTYEQLSGGMQEVVTAAAGRSTLRLGTTARRLLLQRGCIRGLELEDGGGEVTSEPFDGVVLATSAHVTSRLVGDLAPRLSAMLDEVRYFPVTVLLAEYERPVFDPAVRAIVFGPDRQLSNAGAYGVDDLNLVRYTFSGRASRALDDGEVDPERLAAIAEGALAPHADLDGNRRVAMTARKMSPGLCAYHPDQGELLRTMRTCTAGLCGVSIAGDYLRGCSIEACFRAAEEAVGRIDAGDILAPGAEGDGTPAPERRLSAALSRVRRDAA
jgi:oxygen-dependent protoporphyrinogen oxidase